jgi:hypothetical protein
MRDFFKETFQGEFQKKIPEELREIFLEFPECHFIDTGNGMGNSEKQGLPAA